MSKSDISVSSISVRFHFFILTKKRLFRIFFCQSGVKSLNIYIIFDKDGLWLFIWMKMKDQQAVQAPGLLALLLFGLTRMPGHQNKIEAMLIMNSQSLILNISWLTIHVITEFWWKLNKSVLDINIQIIFRCSWGPQSLQQLTFQTQFTTKFW